MTGHILTTPREAELLIARMFANHRSCFVSVREEKAFKKDRWLSLGSLTLESGDQTAEHLMAAVTRGAFEWKLPELSTAQSDLTDLLGLKREEKNVPKLRRVPP